MFGAPEGPDSSRSLGTHFPWAGCRYAPNSEPASARVLSLPRGRDGPSGQLALALRRSRASLRTRASSHLTRWPGWALRAACARSSDAASEATNPAISHPSKMTKRMNPGGLILLVLRTGFEPAIFAVRGRCPEPLDDRSVLTQREYPTGFQVSTGRVGKS